MSTKGTKLTREEFKQKQEIEAARKAGTVPAEVDFVTGKEINPHIPQYILQAPCTLFILLFYFYFLFYFILIILFKKFSIKK